MAKTPHPNKAASPKLLFTAKLTSLGPKGAWTFLQLTNKLLKNDFLECGGKSAVAERRCGSGAKKHPEFSSSFQSGAKVAALQIFASAPLNWVFQQPAKEQSAKLGSRGRVAVTGTLNGLLQQNARKPGPNESPKQFDS